MSIVMNSSIHQQINERRARQQRQLAEELRFYKNMAQRVRKEYASK